MLGRRDAGLLHAAPGARRSDRGDAGDAGSPEAREAMIRKLGLDQPMFVQYGKWFWNMLQGDLGTSIYGSSQPVSTIILEALPRTLSLALLSFVIAIVIAIPAGILSATPQEHRHRPRRVLLRLSGPVDAGFLAGDPADHRLRGQPAMAAGHRLCAAVRGFLALVQAPDPALDRRRHRRSPRSSRG